ncbi:MAG: APC family permease [Desulfomonile tiedjei]|uniref:APC family permease n=1 Tax=Desulfomonile tiedjei TaxID=2358 RepID=A0A9D6Z070_9BACT|nr:APC family permease [Desulfomonile tiedjei]
MKTAVLVIINLALIGTVVAILRKADLLTYYRNGRFWLTWLAVAIITLMDELTSVFYAPAEAHRFIGPSAIFFIAFTAVFIHYMTTRLVEIAEILEYHGVFGGGVYSFSYLVLGPVVSFVAVASIMVDYILTACISAVSAIENATSFFSLSHHFKMMAAMGIVWAIAGLNILGIRDNARFTFSIFILAALVFVNLIASGILGLDEASIGRLKLAMVDASNRMSTGSWFSNYGIFIASVASCVLAYSGVESVLQTAGLVRTWREIGKAYIFLALTVGIVTPVVAALALSADIDFAKHEGDLITHYATMLNGVPFGIAVAVLASLTLIMAVNTAFVASSELLERVAERYNFHWLSVTNRNQSLYRIHLMNAVFFSLIILITQGSQMILADMYALGLIASFCINMASLIIYRYFMGTKEIIHFNTSRLVTLVIFLIFVSCFLFLAWMKPHGTELWATITGIVLVAGLLVAKKRGPEIKEIAQSDSDMDLILHLAESLEEEVHIFFRRPREEALKVIKHSEAYVTFYNPRQKAPVRLAPNHFRFAAQRRSVYQHMVGLLKVVEYELSHRKVNVHFGWPLSSWLDRFSIGVMVFNLMRLPRQFPNFKFEISYPGRPYQPSK